MQGKTIRRMRMPAPVILFGLFATCLDARAACDFSAASAAVQTMLAQDGVSDGGLLIGSPAGVWHKEYFGAYDDSTVVPLASATKMLSGVRILQLADKGVVALDTPVSTYLSGANYPWSATAAPITLRQMFSHTAGYGNDDDDPVLSDHTITLAQSAQEIASNFDDLSPQNYLPVGSLFAYGGVSMQIGGAAAQAQSGVDWQQGWRNDIGAPMCISTIDWQGLGPTLNYRIAGGAQASIEDYARVLAMLADGGVGNGIRILSANAIATIKQSQTGGAALGYAPPTANGNTQYSVGAWVEPSPTSVSIGNPTIESIGKFGFTPWVDFSNNTFGLIMVVDNTSTEIPGEYSHAAMVQIIQTIRMQLAANGGSCVATEVYDEIFQEGFQSTPIPLCPAG
jgi:CubicO group peptidase (beta-lactamase class C family)